VEANGDRANGADCDEAAAFGAPFAFGDNASPQPFPGAIGQPVGTLDTPSRPTVQQRVFGRNRSTDAPGVHAPN
jgi:hypothetical protein